MHITIMSLQATTEIMDSTLKTFLEGSQTAAEGKVMMKELVHDPYIIVYEFTPGIQVKYRQQVIDKTDSVTPLLTHA
jgi:hypothetical protein